MCLLFLSLIIQFLVQFKLSNFLLSLIFFVCLQSGFRVSLLAQCFVFKYQIHIFQMGLSSCASSHYINLVNTDSVYLSVYFLTYWTHLIIFLNFTFISIKKETTFFIIMAHKYHMKILFFSFLSSYSPSTWGFPGGSEVKTPAW